jgi:O-antigen/teichoic acid export membrane protein
MIKDLKCYLKNTVNELTNTGFFHVFGSSVINKVISFASGIILVRILTKADYGVYTYANTVLGFCMILNGFGMSSAVLQVCSEKSDGKERLHVYEYGLGFGAKIDIALGGLILLIALFIPLKIDGANEYLTLMCLMPILTFVPDLQKTYLRAELRNADYAYANTFATAVTYALSLCLALLVEAKGLIFAQYAAFVLTCVLLKKKFNVPITAKNKVPREDRRSLIAIGGISMVNNGLSSMMYYLDIFVLGLVVANENVIAAYKVATTIPTALEFIPSSVAIYAYPYFSRNRNNKSWLISNYKRLVIFLGFANFVIVSALYVLAPFLISLLFGKQYMDSVVPFRILAVSYFFGGTFRVISGNLLVTQRKLKFNTFVAVSSGILNTLLNVLFITHWQSIGAAVATMTTTVATGILNTAYLLRTFEKIQDMKQ